MAATRTEAAEHIRHLLTCCHCYEQAPHRAEARAWLVTYDAERRADRVDALDARYDAETEQTSLATSSADIDRGLF